MKKIAIIQESPYVLDKERTVKKAVEIINSVSSLGAELIVFPEAFIPVIMWCCFRKKRFTYGFSKFR
jgi:predicted amidohydrolase